MISTLDLIKKQLKENPVVLYMKGTPDSPSCGFSAQVVQVLSSCKIDFFSVDVLKNLKIRQELPKYANWPTYPQLWVNGELIGGCNIVLEMFNNGNFLELFKKKIK